MKKTPLAEIVGVLDVDLLVRLRDAFDAKGAVLLRQVCRQPCDFERLSQSMADDFHTVGARQALRQQTGDGHTTEVFRDNFILLGHSEGTYRPYPPPDVCFFMCVKAPVARGGETTLIDGVAMLTRLPERLRQRLRVQGIIYEMQWAPERWKVEFGVEDEAALRKVLGRLDGVRYTLEAGNLHLFCAIPAIVKTREGDESFANGLLVHLPAITHPRYAGLPVYVKPVNRVYFGDGQLLDADTINTIIDAHDDVVYRHRWQDSDVLVIDNVRYMHGREMTEVPCERILISRFGHFRGLAHPGAAGLMNSAFSV